MRRIIKRAIGYRAIKIIFELFVHQNVYLEYPDCNNQLRSKRHRRKPIQIFCYRPIGSDRLIETVLINNLYI